MRKHVNTPKALIIILMTSLIFSSCYKEPSFGFVPAIEFNDISKDIRIDQYTGAKKDSIILTVKFQDGDGDLGFDTEEIGNIVDRTDFNYVVRLFRKDKGTFIEYKPLETLSGFFPKLKNDDKVGPIEGNLSYRIQIETAFWPYKKDTVKFEVYIKDRAGNKSNSTESEPIIINQF